MWYDRWDKIMTKDKARIERLNAELAKERRAKREIGRIIIPNKKNRGESSRITAPAQAQLSF